MTVKTIKQTGELLEGKINISSTGNQGIRADWI
jgi:hypothetical protein